MDDPGDDPVGVGLVDIALRRFLPDQEIGDRLDIEGVPCRRLLPVEVVEVEQTVHHLPRHLRRAVDHPAQGDHVLLRNAPARGDFAKQFGHLSLQTPFQNEAFLRKSLPIWLSPAISSCVARTDRFHWMAS